MTGRITKKQPVCIFPQFPSQESRVSIPTALSCCASNHLQRQSGLAINETAEVPLPANTITSFGLMGLAAQMKSEMVHSRQA
jgi:hypothetical protein